MHQQQQLPKRTSRFPRTITMSSMSAPQQYSSTTFPHESSTSPSDGLSSPSKLPLRDIPGTYGTPFFGAIKDRFDYFYNQGQDDFFNIRMKKYNSTVFRCNMPPGPFLASDPKVVVLLDALTFPILFDNSKVEKKNVLDGTYMPTTKLFGGYRMCAFLDPSEPKHAILKELFLSLVPNLRQNFIPQFRNSSSEFFTKLEDELSARGEANFNSLSDSMAFEFYFRLFNDKYPSETSLGDKGTSRMDLWLALQLAPLITLGLKLLPNFLEDLLLHTFPLPSLIATPGYRKIYSAFYESAGKILDEAEKMGLTREEACHNLVFLAGFNAYGGSKTTLPALMKWVGTAGESFHRRLAEEIRTVVKEEGGVTLSALNKMSLTKSAVYEALRLDPPVPFQYGKAKEDLVVSGHDSSFLIKKGEMLFGYQPFVTKDPKIFDKSEEFVGDRFVGEGEKLLKYVYWSNGRETENPTVGNKQCPGKDLVVLMCRLMLVEFFLRYDTFTVEVGRLLLGAKVTIKSLTKATS